MRIFYLHCTRPNHFKAISRQATCGPSICVFLLAYWLTNAYFWLWKNSRAFSSTLRKRKQCWGKGKFCLLAIFFESKFNFQARVLWLPDTRAATSRHACCDFQTRVLWLPDTRVLMSWELSREITEWVNNENKIQVGKEISGRFYYNKRDFCWK